MFQLILACGLAALSEKLLLCGWPRNDQLVKQQNIGDEGTRPDVVSHGISSPMLKLCISAHCIPLEPIGMKGFGRIVGVTVQIRKHFIEDEHDSGDSGPAIS